MQNCFMRSVIQDLRTDKQTKIKLLLDRHLSTHLAPQDTSPSLTNSNLKSIMNPYSVEVPETIKKSKKSKSSSRNPH